MIAWAIRRFRWVILGWLVRTLAKLGFERSVEEASTKLQSQLPEPLAKAAHALPGDLVRLGGAAVVVSQKGRRASSAARAATKASGRVVAAAGASRRRVGRGARIVGDEITAEMKLEERRLRSDAARERYGQSAATEELLDLREANDRPPLPKVADPIRAGRRRFRPPLPRAPVNRVQRSYRRATKPWDRPLR